MALRNINRGRRSAWTWGAHQGEGLVMGARSRVVGGLAAGLKMRYAQCKANQPAPTSFHLSRFLHVKVIASSLRKGNVVDKDGKLYVFLSAENIHPGKGTPVTQLDMRRISDGVKVSQRYKTTEQVERAHVEDREYQYLYSDGDGAHFMNMETYDQIAVPADVVGDQSAYLQP